MEKADSRMGKADRRVDFTIRRMVKAEERFEASERRMRLFDEKLERSMDDQRQFSAMQSKMNQFFLDEIKSLRK